MFSKTILVSAFAALAYAQSSVLSFTRVPNPITAGDATAITYATNDTSSPVTIILRKGASGHLDTISTLTESATGGQYIWTPSTSLPNGVDYALQITQGTQTNYFGPFSLQGGGASGSSASGSASSYSSMSTTASGAGILGTNMTMTSSHASMGTGMTMPRNTTMSSATLSNTASRTPTATPSSTQDTGLQQTSSGSGAQDTGAASMVGSSLALVFGAAAAVIIG